MRAVTRKKDDMPERQILIGAVVSDKVIDGISQIYKPGFLADACAEKVLVWCLEHFQKYNEAPKKHIEDIFHEQNEKQELTEGESEFIEKLLTSLSDEWTHSDNFNPEFLVDQAKKLFKKQELKKLTSNINSHLNVDDLEAAQKELEAFDSHESTKAMMEGCQSGEDVYLSDCKEPQWLLKNLIPRGLTILAGPSKVGKSTFVLNLTVNLSQAEKAFGQFRGQPGKVLYLSLEDTTARLKIRMKDITDSPEKLRRITFMFQWPKLPDGGLKRIRTWLEKNKGRARLVVIDVLEKVRKRSKGSGAATMYGDDYQVFGPLGDLCKEFQVSILILTHTTKTKADDVFDQILGSMGTQGAADTLMVLSKGTDTTTKILNIRGKDIQEQKLAFENNIDSYLWCYLGDAEGHKLTYERQQIVNLLAEANTAMTTQEIRSAMRDSGVKSVDMLLGKLVRDGEIERHNRGTYAISGHNKARARELVKRSKKQKQGFEVE